MAFGNRVLTTTQDKLLPKAVDTALNSNVAAPRWIGRAKKWSGETLKKTVKVSKNTTGGSFSGFDTFPTTATNNRQKLSFNPKFYKITITLPLDEVSANQVNETQILDLMATEMESSANDMADDIGDLLYGDGTGNSSKDPQGLGAIVDDGTAVATYGGLSRSTFTTLKSTVTASGGTLTLAKMSTLYSAVSSGTQNPTLGLADESVWNLYENLLQPQERIAKSVPMIKGTANRAHNDSSGFVAGSGFTGLFFKGFPILADEKATAQTLFFVNEKHLDWYALPLAMTKPIKFKFGNFEGIDEVPVGMGFSWSDWIIPANQAAIVGHIYLGGNLVSWNPKRHGKLTGVIST